MGVDQDWIATPCATLDKAYSISIQYCEIHFKMKDFMELLFEIKIQENSWYAYFVFKKYSVVDLRYKDRWFGVYLDRKSKFNYVIKNENKIVIK